MSPCAIGPAGGGGGCAVSVPHPTPLARQMLSLRALKVWVISLRGKLGGGGGCVALGLGRAGGGGDKSAPLTKVFPSPSSPQSTGHTRAWPVSVACLLTSAAALL